MFRQAFHNIFSRYFHTSLALPKQVLHYRQNDIPLHLLYMDHLLQLQHYYYSNNALSQKTTSPLANYHLAFRNIFLLLFLSSPSGGLLFHQNSTISHLFFAFHIRLLHLSHNNNMYFQKITSLSYMFHLAFHNIFSRYFHTSLASPKEVLRYYQNDI